MHGPPPKRAILDGMGGPQVGAWVREQIDTRKIVLEEAIEISELGRQTWYDLMADKHPPSNKTQRGVAVALGVEPDWYDRLLAGKKPRASKRPTLVDVSQPTTGEIPVAVLELGQSVRGLLRDAEARQERIADFDSKLAALEKAVARLTSRLDRLDAGSGQQSDG